MELTDFAFRLLLLFFPGIVATRLFESLTPRVKRELHDFVLLSFIFGIFSYGLCALILSLWRKYYWHNKADTFSLFSSFVASKTPINFKYVAETTAIAIILALICTYVYNSKALFRAACKTRITKVHGYQDLWGLFFESPRVQWVVVRDWDLGLLYQGSVQAYSETNSNVELILDNVIVADNATATEIDRLDRIYLSRPSDNLTIEVQRMGSATP